MTISAFDELTGLLSGIMSEPKAIHNGASFSTGGAKWVGGLSNTGQAICIDHYTARMNARTAYHESSQARAVVNRLADTVAGQGMMLEPAPKVDILGLTLEQGEEWSEDVANRYDSFCRSKLQHRSEQMSLYQGTRFSEILAQRDGELFMRLFYSSDRNLISPVQFEFIDPNQIRGDAVTSTEGIMSQYDGIERDERGREKSYKIWYLNAKGEHKETTIPRRGARSGRLFMLHRFAPEYPGQTRGFSRLAHALQEFENITDFTQAQIKKAIAQSNIALFNKPSKEAPASNPFLDITQQPVAGPAVNQFGSDPTPSATAANVTDDSLQPVSYIPIPEATLGVPGSAGVFNLESGEELKPFTNTAPSDNFDTFVDAFTSYLSAAHSIPIEVLLMKFGSNYSASRGALILFWMVAEIWRQESITDIMNPIYEMWLAEEIARNRISAPGWSDPVLRAAWLNCRWIGPSMPNIDPLKTYLADEGYMKLGATTQDRIARDLNGSSGKANRAKNIRTFEETAARLWPYEDNGGNKNG